MNSQNGDPVMLDDQHPNLPAESEAPPEMADYWRVPLSLKVVIFIYFLTGALSITEMVLQMTVFGGLYIDILGVLAIFIGRGLLRWRETWRQWALGFSWLLLAVAFLIGAMSAWDLYTGSTMNMTSRIGPWEGGNGVGIVLSLIMGPYFVWQLRVLRRPDIVQRFKAPRLERLVAHGGRDPAKPARRWQFSLGSLFLMMIVAAFVLVRLTADDVLYDTHHITSTSTKDGRFHGAEYGALSSRFFVQPDKLLYVVLSTGERTWRGCVSAAHGSKPDDTWINLADGRSVSISSKTQLYEIVDGELRTREERVTHAEFDDYIDSNPAEWSLEALVKHAEKMRRRQETREL